MSETHGKPACLVLAAGSGRRFGTDKRLARLEDGRRLLDATLASIPEELTRYIVLQAGDRELAGSLPANWTPVFAADAHKGMGHSLAAGIKALPDCSAVLVALGDMPAVARRTYEAIIAALREDRLVVPRHEGRRGNPVGIGSNFFPRLLDPRGDLGARALLDRCPEHLYWLDVQDAGILRDVDTPEDL